MKPRTPSRRSRRTRNDRGVAFIEFILAVPFLFAMVFGIVETGLGWRAVVQVHSAVRGGARVASKDGHQPSADYDALQAISATLPTDLKSSTSGLVVVIFNAGSSGGTVPPACITATGSHGLNSGSTQCNTYTYADLARPSTDFGCSGGVDNNWCPTSRLASLTLDNMDYLGVYIQTKHLNQTHTYFGDFTIKRQVVFRLEPDLP